jgi:hypothetical protein
VPPTNGTLSALNPSTGVVTYTPNTGFQGTDAFQFTVSTIDNSSAPATVTLIVGPGTPTANPQTVAVVLGTPTEITLTGTDPDVPPLPLNFAIGTLPAHGTLSTHDTSSGLVTYTPNAGYKGADSFTFAVDNGYNFSALATVTLNIAVGKPTANAVTAAVAHNTATKVTLSGTDPDTPPLPLTFDVVTSPTHGALSGLNTTTGTVTYTPNANFQGTDSFTFKVSNGAYTSATATATLKVAVGKPTANAQTVAVKHDTATKITLTGADPDSPALPLTFAIVSSPTHGTLSGLNAATGAVTYTPKSTFFGTDSFTFTVSNGTNTSATATVTLNVAEGTPTANPQTVTVALNTKTTITLTGSDPDSPVLLVFAIATKPAHGTLGVLNAQTGVVTYTPNANYKGTDSFTFTVSNGTNTSAPATVTLKVGGG